MTRLLCLLLAGLSSQTFIDADNDRATGYGGGYEFVVRHVPGDVDGVVRRTTVSLRDFATVQNEWRGEWRRLPRDGWGFAVDVVPTGRTCTETYVDGTWTHDGGCHSPPPGE